MNRTLDMILRNLKTEIARITKENENLKTQIHILNQRLREQLDQIKEGVK